MKFTFDGYEIDIKVKNTLLSDRANKYDTLSFMNRMLGWFFDSIEDSNRLGFEDLAEHQRKEAYKLFEQLTKHGAYNKL